MGKTRSVAMLGLVGALIVAGCTSGDTDAEPAATTVAEVAQTEPPPETVAEVDTTPAPTEETVADTAAPDTTPAEDPYAGITGEAPGVTDTTIKIGVTYVDVTALAASGLEFDLGPFEAAYGAYAEYINANGGINGRNLELVMVPIDPSTPPAADAACVKLTEDDDVFIVAGFWRLGAECVTDLHATALVSGSPNADTLAAAKAPWITPNPDADVPAFVTKALAESGALEGTLGVVGQVQEQAEVDIAVAALGELGIEPAEVATIDAPTDDTAAVQAAVKAIAERFKAKGVDVVLLAGASSGSQWPTHMNDDSSYRPSLRFTAYNAPQSFTANAANVDADFTVLDGALIGGLYGPDQAIYEEPGMTECLGVIAAAGVEAPAPSTTSGELGDNPYQASFEACRFLTIIKEWATKAGPNLNYGTLAAVLEDGLVVEMPGDPKPRNFGTGSAADGNPQAFIYEWDAEAFAPVLVD